MREIPHALRFPPRGSGIEGADEAPPDFSWWAPETLPAAWNYTPGKVLLGQHGSRRLGFLDNRHMVTIAGSRAGKTQTLLIPNLRDYPGSAVVIDPKGELAEATAAHRAAPISDGGLGQDVYILNPFPSEVPGLLAGSHAHNPFDELKHSTPANIGADVAQIADALIIDNARDSHWTDSAKNLITGLILYALVAEPKRATIQGLREMLADAEALPEIWSRMAESDAFGGRLRNIGRSFLGKIYRNPDGSLREFTGELSSILSTANEQTRPLDDVAHIAGRSDFSLASIATRPTTIYLVLPGLRIGTHARWLRLFIYQLLAALERRKIEVNEREGLWPLWLVLEEFAALGNMQAIETAAGYMAGFGIRLWAVLQDLTQIKTHYPHSWETFLGNAGIINAFAVVDATTTDYLSKLLGNTTILERRYSHLSTGKISSGEPGFDMSPRTVPLLEPAEITLHFARDTERQIVKISGRPPIYMQRLPYKKGGA